MAKKRAREADGQSEPAQASVDKMDEDGSSDDEVNSHLQGYLTFTSHLHVRLGLRHGQC